MKIPRRQFLSLAAGAAGLPVVSRVVRAQVHSCVTINTDPANGIYVVNGAVEFALNSPLWKTITGGPPHWDFCQAGMSECPNADRLRMNMAQWDPKKREVWYSAQLVLYKALGFGTYELSIEVAQGKGVATTFYLSEVEIDPKEPSGLKPKDHNQEIDFELGTDCGEPPIHHPDKCSAAKAWTNIWWAGAQYQQNTPLKPDLPLPDTTANIYRYKIDWRQDGVVWYVDTGSVAGYVPIRGPVSKGKYIESKCYPFISFWAPADFLGSVFTGKDTTAVCDTKPCYQAFYFGRLRFTPAVGNTLTCIGS